MWVDDFTPLSTHILVNTQANAGSRLGLGGCADGMRARERQMNERGTPFSHDSHLLCDENQNGCDDKGAQPWHQPNHLHVLHRAVQPPATPSSCRSPRFPAPTSDAADKSDCRTEQNKKSLKSCPARQARVETTVSLATTSTTDYHA